MMNVYGEYVNAGTNEFYRYGKKARERVAKYLTPNDKGFYGIPVNGGKYYAIGTSTGKYGEFAKWSDTFFSVNSNGILWAKVGTDKAERFVAMLNKFIADMEAADKERLASQTSGEDDENEDDE